MMISIQYKPGPVQSDGWQYSIPVRASVTLRWWRFQWTWIRVRVPIAVAKYLRQRLYGDVR